MSSTDVSSTKDTEGVAGEDGGEQYTQDKVGPGQTKDTTGPMGETAAQTHRDATAIFPDQSGTLDTEQVGGQHTSRHAKDDPATHVRGTLDTQTGGGSPIQHAAPAYRAPKNYPSVSGTYDTTRTDKPVNGDSDATFDADSGTWSDPDTIEFAERMSMSGTYDTTNPRYPMQTTSDNLPGTPGAAPTVAAKPRGVLVTVPHLSNPSGAPIRGYRIEGSTGGVDFAGASDASVLVTNLVPSQSYKFRYAAFNDNGVGPFSAWSAAVTPLNPDEAGPGHATGVSPETRVNPIYTPDGVVKAGTGGTTGPVGSPVAAADATQGHLVLTWTAPAWGVAPTNYDLVLSTGETHTVGAVLTYTFTGLSAVARTATITPRNARGKGVPATTNSATPHA